MSSNLGKIYEEIKSFVVHKGFETEIKWQNDILSKDVNESTFLKEAAWVVLSAGFREEVLRRVFPKISLCFCEWESSEEILQYEQQCFECALEFFNNRRKIKAILGIAQRIQEAGFDTFLGTIKENPIEELKKLPYIGEVTTYHLAKNIGFNIAKPDRHLVRIANIYGESDVNVFCQKIADETGDAVAVIDLVLWRYATLNNKYESVLKEFSKTSQYNFSFNQPNP